MHHLVYLVLTLLSLSLCVIAAPSSLSESRSTDQSIQALAEEANHAFGSRTLTRRSTTPANSTTEEGVATLQISPPNAEITATCFNPRAQPPTFHCLEALHKFLRSFDHSKTYIIRKSTIPVPPIQPIYYVPKRFVAGTCKLDIDVNSVIFSAADVKGSELKQWSSELISKCVSDERYSGGGLLEVVFGRGREGGWINLFISVGSTIFDDDYGGGGGGGGGDFMMATTNGTISGDV